jgi:hemerythrin
MIILNLWGELKMYFEWKDSYSVNIAEINEQHKKLFQIGGKISDLVFAKDEFDHYDEIMEILQELRDYTIYHFNYEEELMKKYNFEGLDIHKIEHTFLTKKIMKFQNKDLDSDQKEAIANLVAFISDWISGHILKTDMQYRGYLNGKGVN